MTNEAPHFPIYQPGVGHDDTEQDPVSSEVVMVAGEGTVADRIREIQAIDSKLGIVDDALAKLSMLPEGYKTHSSSMGGVVLLESEAQGGWISYEPDWTSLQCALRDTKREARREQRAKNKMGTVAKLRAAGAAACSALFRNSASIEEASQRRQALLDELFPCQITNETLQQRGIHLPKIAEGDLSKLYDISPYARLSRHDPRLWCVAYRDYEIHFEQPYKVVYAALSSVAVNNLPLATAQLWEYVQPHILQLADSLQTWQHKNSVANAASERQRMLAYGSTRTSDRRLPTAADLRATIVKHQLEKQSSMVVQELEYIQKASETYGERLRKQRALQNYTSEASTKLDAYALGLAQQLVESDEHKEWDVEELFRYIAYVRQDMASSDHTTSHREYFRALAERMPKGTRLDYAAFRQALLR